MEMLQEELGIEYNYALNCINAKQEVDSGQYEGVFVNSLVIPLGRGGRLSEKFSTQGSLSRTLSRMYLGGLELVDYASQKGLPVIVQPISAPKEVREEAERCGAKKILKALCPVEATVLAFKEVFGL